MSEGSLSFMYACEYIKIIWKANVKVVWKATVMQSAGDRLNIIRTIIIVLP